MDVACCIFQSGIRHTMQSEDQKIKYMMTSSNGNIFRVTGPLCGEFTGPGEFPTRRPVTRSFGHFCSWSWHSSCWFLLLALPGFLFLSVFPCILVFWCWCWLLGCSSVLSWFFLFSHSLFPIPTSFWFFVWLFSLGLLSSVSGATSLVGTVPLFPLFFFHPFAVACCVVFY